MSEGRIYKLYGVLVELFQKEIGGPFEEARNLDLVATFSSHKKAEAYVERRKLKQPISRRGFTSGRMFRKNSTLGEFEDYEIQLDYQVNIPHDPE